LDSIGCYGDIEREFTFAERKALDAEGRAILTQHDVQVIWQGFRQNPNIVEFLEP
jgi:hypothetical protein